MPNLNLLLQSKTDDSERMEFMYEVFDKIKAKVNQILLFGPCNNYSAEQAAQLYYQKQQKKFFQPKYREEELKALPAVMANILYLDSNKGIKSDKFIDFDRFLKDSFLYGTGTCEFFAIVGAYCLATEFDVTLSLETIYSNEAHTYIRLHTDPEYILDFWSPMICEYKDNITWYEVLGEPYKRSKDAEYKTDITLSSAQLIKMGNHVFTEENKSFRSATFKTVENKVTQFYNSTSKSSKSSMEQFEIESRL